MSIPTGPAVGWSGTGQGRNNTHESGHSFPGRAVLPLRSGHSFPEANETPEPVCWSSSGAVSLELGGSGAGSAAEGSAAVTSEAELLLEHSVIAPLAQSDRLGSTADVRRDRFGSSDEIELVGETGNADEVEGDQCRVTLSALEPCRATAPLRRRERDSAPTSGCPRMVQPTLLLFTRPDPTFLELNCMENSKLGEDPSFAPTTATISQDIRVLICIIQHHFPGAEQARISQPSPLLLLCLVPSGIPWRAGGALNHKLLCIPWRHVLWQHPVAACSHAVAASCSGVL